MLSPWNLNSLLTHHYCGVTRDGDISSFRHGKRVGQADDILNTPQPE